MASKVARIGVVGLGYVGLPLLELLARKFDVVGVDNDPSRVQELTSGKDRTGEVTEEQLRACSARFTANFEEIASCNVVIVTVPTPIDASNRPNLNPIRSATESVGRFMTKGTTVVYESTVFPGVTEEICVPILEEKSGLSWKKDFHVGYSPERVNPGDKNHTIDKIIKVVAGDDASTGDLLVELYGSIITAGIHRAPDIKTAEAAKVIENTQRDLNIALMNELSIIFNMMGLSTPDVLAAASTKWNFLPFYPGLVGGHCIGVDPYYLTHKAEELGYHPQVILSGRRINDRMGVFVAEQTVKRLAKRPGGISGGKVLICGFTFKENVPDLRNTKVIDIYNEIKEYGLEPVVYEPVADPADLKRLYGIDPISSLGDTGPYEAIILAVKHDKVLSELSEEKIVELQREQPVVMDLKGILNRKSLEAKGVSYFCL